MPYDHYLVDMPELGEVLESITEEGEDIMGMFYVSDSSQVCIVVRTNKIDVNSKTIEKIFKREEYST